MAETLQIPVQKLERARPVCGFDGRATKPITDSITVPIQVGDHYAPLNVLYLANLGNVDLIIGKAWLQSHGVIINVHQGELSFKPGVYQHPC